MAEEREFGVAATFDFPLVVFGSTDADFSTGVTFDVSAGDIRLSKDGSTWATINDTTPTLIGLNSGIYSLDLDSTEMSAARAVVIIIDQTSTKIWEDQAIIISTYGSTLGLHAFNRNTTGVNVDSIDIGAITSTAIIAGAILAEKFATNAIDAAALATDAVNKIARAVGIQTNTAFNDIEVLMVDVNDHVTPKTGLTVTGERSIDGTTFVAVEGTIAEVSNGIYQFDAESSDLNGSVITLKFSGTSADDAFITLTTVS